MTPIVSVLSALLSLSFVATATNSQQNGCQDLEASFPANTFFPADVQYANDSIGKDTPLKSEKRRLKAF